jgi:hypothetical protein
MNFECWAAGTWAAGSWVVGSWCPGATPPAPAPSGEGRYYFQRRHFAQSDLWREDEEIIILKP